MMINKVLILVQIITLLGTCFLIYLGTGFGKNVVPSDFHVGDLKDDLMGASVALPQGQLWVFAKDQDIKVNLISKKVVDGVVVLLAHLYAEVKLPPSKDKDAPTHAISQGYVRLFYEKIEGSWRLVYVEPMMLKLTGH